MAITLRSYQTAALNTTLEAAVTDQTILVQMATGAGKTIFFSALIRKLIEQWPWFRIGILAHRKELITQAFDKLIRVWPDAVHKVGIACASTGIQVDTDKPVVIGSIQTLARRLEETAPFDLIIIDEAHRIPPTNQNNQYAKFISQMYHYNKATRFLGVTATPYRLGHGYIYGTKCKHTHVNLFHKLHYSVCIRELQALGFLCKYRAKEAKDISKDLKRVKTSGDYVVQDLSDMMAKEEHITSAVRAYQEFASDRKRVVVFAVTIEHAEKIKAAFRDAGYSSATVHSKMPMGQRDMVLREFEAGRIRILVNVMVLSEGWDSPAVDCIIMCRPTKAVALYVQFTGRGLRPHPDKEDVLILDLASNCTTHGDPADPHVPVPFGVESDEDSAGIKGKVCPKCKSVVLYHLQQCPDCGYVWPEKEEPVEAAYTGMKDVIWGDMPTLMEVTHAHTDFQYSRTGNTMMVLTLHCVDPEDDYTGKTTYVKEYLLFDPEAHPYARKKAQDLWRLVAGTEPPETVNEAFEREGELLMSVPEFVEIIKKGDYWKVHLWRPNRGTNEHTAAPSEQGSLRDVRSGSEPTPF